MKKNVGTDIKLVFGIRPVPYNDHDEGIIGNQNSPPGVVTIKELQFAGPFLVFVVLRYRVFEFTIYLFSQIRKIGFSIEKNRDRFREPYPLAAG